MDSIVFGTCIPDDGASSNSLAELLIAGCFVAKGRFRLIRLLGLGGMGVVWLAEDVSLNHPVALKFLSRRVRDKVAELQRQREELLHARRLRHPNIVTLFDWHEAEGEIPFISMEFIEGDTLTRYRLRQPFQVVTWAQLHPLILQMGEALKYAHEHERIVHRDLKPGNLMLTPDGVLKVADFGLAQVYLPVDDSPPTAHRMEGTLLYMSPQQSQGVTPRPTDDIYSLGATLYELLTGTPPFYPDEVEQQLLNMRVQSMSERLAALEVNNPAPAKARVLIGSCLEKDPLLRPQSVREFLSRLPSIDPHAAQTTASAAPREPWHSVFTEPPPSNRILALFKNVSIPLLVVGLVGFVLILIGVIPSRFLLWTDAQRAAAQLAPSHSAASEFDAAIQASNPSEPRASEASAGQTGSLSFQLTATDSQLKKFSYSLFDSKGQLSVSNQSASPGKPVTLPPLPVGRYELVAYLPEVGGMIRTNVIVQESLGPSLGINFSWTPLKVFASPADARITVHRPTLTDANALKHILSGEEVLVYPGIRRIDVSLRGYFNLTTNVFVAPASQDESQSIEVDLEPQLWPGQEALEWTNSIGMKFSRLSKNGTLMATTEVTREQYRHFAEAADPPLTPGMNCLTMAGWSFIPTRSWEDPGFAQEENHPVVGVSWEEANRFCEWLARVERHQRRLAPSQTYSLPTDIEYNLAIWDQESSIEKRDSRGNLLLQWPWQEEEFRSKLNFAGNELTQSPYPWPWDLSFSARSSKDEFVRTAPADDPGDFNPINGCYGLAGNVAEWCLGLYQASLNPTEIREADLDFFRVDGANRRMIRGGSWFDHDDIDLSPHTRRPVPPSARHDHIGFRVVLHVADER